MMTRIVPLATILARQRRNAQTLGKWLTSATGERVTVQPILTLPGWWVLRKAKGDVNVMNPQEIRHSFVMPELPPSTQQIQRVAHQLTERCRFQPAKWIQCCAKRINHQWPDPVGIPGQI